jgi:DNA-binding NtrC family response regulator
VKAVAILEDDRMSLTFLRAALERDYRVMTTEIPEGAFAICNTEPLPDLIIADNMLRSASSGIEILLRVHECRPQMPLLIVSGTPPEGWSDSDFDCFAKLVSEAAIGFLLKPFTAAAIKGEVCDLLARNWDSQEIQTLFEQAARYRQTPECWRCRFPTSQAL